MSQASNGGEQLSRPDGIPVGPVDAVLAAFALGAPLVGELVATQGSVVSLAFDGVAAVTGTALFVRLDRAQRVAKNDTPLLIPDQSDQL